MFHYINNIACLFVYMYNYFFRRAPVMELISQSCVSFLDRPHPKMMSLRNWLWALCVADPSPHPQSHPEEIHWCPE